MIYYWAIIDFSEEIVMRKVIAGALLLLILLTGLFVSCTSKEETPVLKAGRYVGYSWKGEAKGTPFNEASEYIQTVLEIDQTGKILDAKMWFWVKSDGYWITRQSGAAFVEVDFKIDPVMAGLGNNSEPGKSMFKIHTADMMSFYTVAVDSDGTVAIGIVDPITRYLMEMKFGPEFDFNTKVGMLTVDNALMIPTVLTSSSGFMKPKDFSELDGRSILKIHDNYSHVVNQRGELAGIDDNSSIKDFVAALGVTFIDGRPQRQGATYGYFGIGGWQGNYDSIQSFLIGKNAKEVTSLVNWSIDAFAKGVNNDRQFGIDNVSGATKTAQWSVNGISGATVRMSRESTSYQRALVQAGIITENQVVIGRF